MAPARRRPRRALAAMGRRSRRSAQSVMPARAFASRLRKISDLASHEETGVDQGRDNVGRRQFLTQWVVGRILACDREWRQTSRAA